MLILADIYPLLCGREVTQVLITDIKYYSLYAGSDLPWPDSKLDPLHSGGAQRFIRVFEINHMKIQGDQALPVL